MAYIKRIDEMTFGQKLNLQPLPYKVGEMVGYWKVTISKPGFAEFVFCPYGDPRTQNDLIVGSTTDDKVFKMFITSGYGGLRHDSITYEMPKDAFFAFKDSRTDREEYYKNYRKK